MSRFPKLLCSAVLSLLIIACRAYESREADVDRLLEDAMSMPMSGEDAMSMHMSAKGKGKTGSSISSKGKGKGKGGKGGADEYMDMHFSIEMSMSRKGRKSSKKSSKSAKSSKKGAGIGGQSDDMENHDDIIGK
jgi:hypothetical protein